MRQIVLSMPQDEFLALQKDAQRELRPVKDHARYILRVALGLENTERVYPSSVKMNNRQDASNLSETGIKAVDEINP